MEKDKTQNNLITSTSTALGELRDNSIDKIMKKTGLDKKRRKRKHNCTSRFTNSYINSIAVYNGIIVSGSDDHTIKLWDLKTGECINTLEGHTGYVNSLAVYNGIIVSGSYKTIKLWDLKTGECINTLQGHNRGVNSIAVYNGIIVSGSGDKTIKYWNLKTGEILLTLYSLSGGYFWESPPEEGFPYGKFYTDRPDLIQVYECNEHDDGDTIPLPSGNETREAYISIHNDKNIMLRINNRDEYKQKAKEYIGILEQTKGLKRLEAITHEFKMLETRPENDVNIGK